MTEVAALVAGATATTLPGPTSPLIAWEMASVPSWGPTWPPKLMLMA